MTVLHTRPPAEAPRQPRTGLIVLSPAYFALVMATGIVSVAAWQSGMRTLAFALLYLNFVAYASIGVMMTLRLKRYPREVLADLADHQRGPGFFTVVAATCILGSQSLRLLGVVHVAAAFFVAGLLLWTALTYGIFTALIVKEHKPELADGISGAWLIAVVATQSIAVLAGLLAAHVPQPIRVEMNFAALSMWLFGGMLYIWMISLIFYRYTFFRFSPADLSPPYWINMGAMAISTLAGATLIGNTPDAPFLRSLLPFLKGFTVFYWATGTWWIPMLIVLALWRHVYRGFPLTYDPLYWGAVFPLGMYTVSTFEMARAMELDFLLFIPRVFVYVALTAWAITFAALLRSLWRGRGGGLLSRASAA